MKYDVNFLKTFDGGINPLNVDMSELANTIEANVSQYEYCYETNLKECPKVVIQVTNENIPHLLGLSKNHHNGLPEYNARAIFEGLKSDWTLESLKKGDSKWFLNNKDKIVGVMLLYQILHIKECKVYSTKHIFNTYLGRKFKRDNIYFVVFKLSNKKKYTIELSPIKGTDNKFIPRSLKINDKRFNNCEEISMSLISRERIRRKSKKKKFKKVRWSK
ncbi:hypothetical protein [Apilactobacillus bombintestini]|uniref:Phage-Barnase-EndoU-ColicinE5/D-RelE like nuclease 4 domain-containing protein n=1 Tax=Apilactobacillus bombintestini TaxID=2419772 RepID=A0A387AN96_9LACO|nr:hypothetical protein [Apilactobacillus bombintestini]AYF92142.1 hypothetical protein D7I45_00880 [Apilactobacillus bombintestini]